MELETRRPTISVDGGSMAAFFTAPVTDSKLPGVIIIHDVYGLSAHAEDVASRFAAQGYATLVPDLFWHIPGPREFTDRASFMRFRQQLDDRQILSSIDAAVAHLREQPFVDVSHIAIVGFCMGGYYAFLEAINNPTLAACADFYGAPLRNPHPSERSPRSTLDAARGMRVPFLGLFGEEDQSIPLDQVEELKAVLKDTGVPFEIRVYPGAGHAFFNDTAPSYRQQAAEDAWQRTLSFFARYNQRR